LRLAIVIGNVPVPPVVEQLPFESGDDAQEVAVGGVMAGGNAREALGEGDVLQTVPVPVRSRSADFRGHERIARAAGYELNIPAAKRGPGKQRIRAARVERERLDDRARFRL